MSRLPAIDPSRAEGETKHLLDAVQSSFNATPNVFRVAANSAAALSAMVQMSGALAKGVLSPKIREAIALAVAEANQCDYCLSAHAVLGRAAGLPDSEVERARAGTSDDPKQAAVLAFALEILRKRAHVGQDDVKKVKAAGVTDAELAEIVANVVLNIYTNYLNTVADTEIDFPVQRAHAHA